MTALETLEDRFRIAMRRTASGVAVLATDGPHGRAGVTVSTFCSLSMQPPSVIACVHQRSHALAAILGNGVFTANALAEDQRALAETFAGQGDAQGEGRFATAPWSYLATGAPAVMDALASFDCQVGSTLNFGSHCILIGEVVELAVRDAAPLVYANQSFRRLAAT